MQTRHSRRKSVSQPVGGKSLANHYFTESPQPVVLKPLLVTAVLLVALAGCSIPTFEQPLVSPELSSVPAGAYGLYRAKATDGDGEGFVHVGPAGDKFPPGFLRLVGVNHPTEATTALEVNQFIGFVEPVGGSYVFHLPLPQGEQGLADQSVVWKEQWNAAKVDRYLLVKIGSANGRLSLSMPDPEFVAAEITAGRLAGSVTEKQVGQTSARYKQIVVTADTRALKACFAQHIDGELFGKEFVTLTRVEVEAN